MYVIYQKRVRVRVSKVKQVSMLKNEINAIYAEIRETCSLLRYMLILRTMTTLHKNLYQEVMAGHIKKTSKLVYKKFDVEEHINNISSYHSALVFSKAGTMSWIKFRNSPSCIGHGCQSKF